MAKIITVVGATGAQGGSVITAILNDPKLSQEFKIRGITRDTTKPNAQALVKRGVEVVSADINSKESMTAALQGSHTVFLVTNYWESMDAGLEKSQGMNVTDVAKEVGVQHLIFSTLLNVTDITNGRLRHVVHFDSKADVAEYILQTGIPCTFVLPGYYMSNAKMILQKGDDGSYSMALPFTNEGIFPLLETVSDFGKFVLPALQHPETYNKGSQILAAQAYYPVSQLVHKFESTTGRTLHYTQITPDQYKSFLPDNMANEMLENHLLLEDPGYYNGMPLDDSLKAVHDLGLQLTSWEDYLKAAGY